MRGSEGARVRLDSAVAVGVGAIVFVACSVLAIVGGLNTGISNDEPTHQGRLAVWFESGLYVPERFLDGDGLSPDIAPGRAFGYGPAFGIVAHLVAVVARIEEFGLPTRGADSYASRHLVVAGLGIAAALAVGLATWLVTRSRVIGVWAAAATMALPLWVGYSMFAVKDVPAAAGWTFFTTALVITLVPPRGRWQPIAAGVLVATGVWFAVGVRSALWVPLLVQLLVFAALVMASKERRRLRASLVALTTGIVVASGLIAVVYARKPPSLRDFFLGTVRSSGDFHWVGETLSAGVLVTEKPPWWYLPAWIGGSVPILIGVLFLVGLVLASIGLVRRHPGHDTRGIRTPSATAILWGMQALMLPVGATLLGSTMYGGMRQHVYVLPAVAAIAAITAYALWRYGRFRVAVVTLLSLAIVTPAVEAFSLHPYQYVYKNVLAGPINDRWESDMHYISGREAVQRVPEGTAFGCYTRALVRPSGEIAVPSIGNPCNSALVKSFIAEQGALAVADAGDAWWVIARKYRGSPVAETCEEVASVTRKFRGETIVMSYVMNCDADFYESRSTD